MSTCKVLRLFPRLISGTQDDDDVDDDKSKCSKVRALFGGCNISVWKNRMEIQMNKNSPVDRI